MRRKIDRTNKPWNKHISDEDIYNKEFSIAYLISTNTHLDMFKHLEDVVLSTYNVTAKFTYLGYNGDRLICNNQTLVYRKDKFSDYTLGKDVKEISSNLSHKGGGSHNHPSIAYKGAEIVLQFISYGLPFIDSLNGWKCEIINIEKV